MGWDWLGHCADAVLARTRWCHLLFVDPKGWATGVMLRSCKLFEGGDQGSGSFKVNQRQL
jgi:hypothetical protein